MKTMNATPLSDGFYMPAEFSPHYGCILTCPELADSCHYGGYAVRKACVLVSEGMAHSEKGTVWVS